MADQYSITPSGAGDTVVGTSINVDRRIFNFGERIAELAPNQSPFFSYLSNVAKVPTDDPVFKFLEQRHQWQRRNFQITSAGELTAAAASTPLDANWDVTAFDVECLYDKYGKEVTTAVRPEYFVIGQMVAVECEWDEDGSDGSDKPAIAYYRVTAVNNDNSAKATLSMSFIKAMLKATRSADGAAAATKGLITVTSGDILRFDSGMKGQVIGSAFAEGGTDPEGWKDEFYNREGYCQIFKTSVPLFSGTALATRYRGKSNEYMRVYQEKLMEHKMDLEHAMLFGIGTDHNPTSGGPLRRTWGIVPYTEAYGKVKTFAYASANYDHFIDAMEDVFSPESGNSGEKLVLASRKVLSWLNKLGGDSFLGNTMASGARPDNAESTNAYGLDVQNIKGSFGHHVTRVSTLYGNLNFVLEPLFRNQHEHTAIMIDLNNVAYRPLAGNGVSRDTQIITNVQGRNVDGRKDMILTESGLEIQLPETHTVLQFS
jgi:hypothetical protein